MAGVAHSTCNLQYAVKNRYNWKLVVLMHNFGRFDAKFLIQAVKKRHGEIRILPNNMEKFLSFSLDDVTFIDLYNFL